MKMQRRQVLGVTLVEMLLVAAVIGMFFVMLVGYTTQRTRSTQIDRASQQMQQILNAGLSYYNSHGEWPANLAALQSPSNYVPTGIKSPWNTDYVVTPMPTGVPAAEQIFLQVSMQLPTALAGRAAIAAVIAGKVPFGNSVVGPPTQVTAFVNIPGQNLNNATAVNFAGMFHHSSCVPVPVCPAADTNGNAMTPQVMVTPSSVSGTNDGDATVYPISSFTASVSGLPSASPDPCVPGGTATCSGNSNSGQFWRVCLSIVTTKGPVTLDATTAEWAVAMAMTRCSVVGEPAGNGELWGP